MVIDTFEMALNVVSVFCVSFATSTKTDVFHWIIWSFRAEDKSKTSWSVKKYNKSHFQAS